LGEIIEANYNLRGNPTPEEKWKEYQISQQVSILPK
jgi:hypothetical protein